MMARSGSLGLIRTFEKVEDGPCPPNTSPARTTSDRVPVGAAALSMSSSSLRTRRLLGCGLCGAVSDSGGLVSGVKLNKLPGKISRAFEALAASMELRSIGIASPRQFLYRGGLAA